MRHHRDDVLLTGVPRSGTTLCCALLNQSPDVLALVEPMRIADFAPAQGQQAACDHIAAFLAATRERALREGRAPSLQREGVIVDNPIGQAATERGTRPRVVQLADVEIGRVLPADFRLVIKHNALFTALLPELCARFAVYAVVRDPLAVLASWNSVELSVREGRVPAGELYDDALRRALDAEPDRLARQLCVLDWFFDRILRHVPAERIIRYEEMVAGRAGAGSSLGIPPTATEPLGNRGRGYPKELLQELSVRLAGAAGAWQRLYAQMN